VETTGTGHDCTMSTTTFGDQLADLWRTRPVRLPDRGPIAGVAAGIGYRYGVDPVLIRIAFVVSTIFGGAGLVLYLACWLLLSDARHEFSRAEALIGGRRRGPTSGKTILLVIALCIALGTIGPIGVGLGGSGLISTALMLAGVWLLYQRRPLPPPLPAGMSQQPQHDSFGPAAGFGRGCGPTGFGHRGFGHMGFGHMGFGSPWQYGPPAYNAYTPLPDHYESGPEAAPRVAADLGSVGAPEPDRTSEPSQPGAEPNEASPPSAAPPAGEAGTTTTAQPSFAQPSFAQPPLGQPLSAQPPSWDPLGVAPFAWDLPEPTPAQPPAAVPVPRRRSRLTTTVIGLAILTAAGCGAAAALGAEWLTPARIGAIALAVVGIGLLIGAFLRRGYGLLIVTAPLLGFVVLASLVGPIELNSTGNQTWQPATTADLRPEYVVRFGESTLDLRGLELTQDRSVYVKQEFGQATVLIPENMNVRSHCEMQFGDAICLPEGLTGGPDGTEGPVLTLDVDGRFGKVEVLRG
jgi:phage shock protein PspC (stress-responsive transcriptional regulator)